MTQPAKWFALTDKYAPYPERGFCDEVEAEIKEALAALRAEPVAVPMLVCDIEPRPLLNPLSDYHKAMSEGPLNYTWRDKPHRLVYDLIAAVKYYASPPQSAPLTDAEEKLRKVHRYLDDVVYNLKGQGKTTALTALAIINAPQPKD